ncbi:unnamed protein product [Adineta steineri]|uniref:Uncharacterized protein n=2 Tax=Adineta steineri TaxID=433720 RepID=A0A819SM20_9BILA|nr:unnamed protein product [Adineta steineri]
MLLSQRSLILYILATGIITVLGQQACEDFAVDETDCTKFIRCFDNVRIRFTCTAGTAWEDSIKTCVSKEQVQACKQQVKQQRKFNMDNDTIIYEADINALNSIPVGKTLAEARALGPIVTPKQYQCSLCNTGACGIVVNVVQCICGNTQCQPATTPTTVQPRNPCAPNPCLNGGQCVSLGAGFICNCPATFTGNRCEAPAPTPCQPNPCQNGGTCIPQGTSFYCQCPSTHNGYCCENRITTTTPYNPCAQSPCQNGGTCIPQGTSFYCQCPPTHNGVCCQTLITTTTPFNPCVQSPCQNGGTCIPQGTSFYCQCPPTHNGFCCETLITTTTPFNPCAQAACQNGGQCIPTGNSYLCQCPTGYYGTRCESRNYCMPNPCANNGLCTQTTTGYICSCLHPYTGTNCQQIITTTTTATTTLATRAPCDGGCCCIVIPCPTIVITNPCLPNPCQNNGGCAVQNNAARCWCPDSTQGYYCQYSRTARSIASKPCNMTCYHGGQCYNDERNGGQARCSCPNEYFGANCEFVNRPKTCSPSNPCMNNGKCMTTSVGSQCNCQKGTSGILCERVEQSNDAKYCPLNCQAGGLCVFVGSTPECRCPQGRFGRLCEKSRWSINHHQSPIRTYGTSSGLYQSIYLPNRIVNVIFPMQHNRHIQRMLTAIHIDHILTILKDEVHLFQFENHLH